MSRESPGYVACPKCGKMGYTDERQFDFDSQGYLCARCARPWHTWSIITNA